MRCLLIAAVALALVPHSVAAAPWRFEFSGQVDDLITITVFGHDVAPGTAVQGWVVADPSAVATTWGILTSYRHQVPRGLHVTFGDLVVEADEYLIDVTNNPAGPDLLRIANGVISSPTPEFPLRVDGQLQTGVLMLFLRDVEGQLLEGAGIPPSVDIALADHPAAVLTDRPGKQAPQVQATLAQWTTAAHVPTGDYDGSGAVDGGDLLLWQRTFGSTAALAADGDGDGVVGTSDLSLWRSAYGSTSAVAVPEPASWLALALTAGLAFCGRAAWRV